MPNETQQTRAVYTIVKHNENKSHWPASVKVDVGSFIRLQRARDRSSRFASPSSG